MKFRMFAGACVAAAASFAAAPLLAQQAPARPAAKPAAKPAEAPKPADNKTLSFGSGSGTGPILTKEELRACLAQEDSLRTRLTENEARRPPLTQEKERITVDQAQLRTERAPIDDFKTQADALAERFKAHSARVETWNQAVKAFNESPPGSARQAEARRVELNKEREELEKLQKALEEEKNRFAASSEAAVRAYNEKAQALDTRVNEWNARNQALNDESRALAAERQGWVTTCANRRYREDDEIAIRQGK